MSEMEGHRVKRIKTEDVAKSRNTGSFPASGHVPNVADTHDDVVMDLVGDIPHTNDGVNMAALAAYGAASVVANIEPTDSSKLTSAKTISAPSAQLVAEDPMEVDTRLQPQPKNPEIDLSSAPADPIELAIWVAQQISHFQDEGRDSMELDDGQNRSRLLSHPPGIYSRRLDEDNDPTKVAEREKLREENRERKKRWRLSNTERSTY